MAKKTALEDDASIYQKRSPEKERVKLKGLSAGKKIEYIKDYYLKAAIAIGVSLTVIIYILVIMIRPKDEVLLRSITINDSYTIEDIDTLIEDFGKTIDYNPDKQDISITDGLMLDPEKPSSNTLDQVTVYATTGTLDVIIADEDVFKMYAKNGFFCDLSDVLSQDELKNFSKNLLYEKLNPANEEDMDSDDEAKEDTNVEHAYGVCLDDSSIYTNMSKWYKQQKESKSTGSFYIGIVNTSKQKENSVAFIKYLKGIQ